LATGSLAESGGDVALAHAGRSGDEHIEVLVDPSDRRERAEGASVDPTAVRRVDVFDAGARDPQRRVLHQTIEATVVARAVLRVDQQREALVEG